MEIPEFHPKDSLSQIPLKNQLTKALEQTILLLGGEDGMSEDNLLMLENNGKNRKELNIKLPYSMYGHGAQFLNDNLYIFGGCNDNEEELVNWIYKLSKSLQWEKMANMNQKRDRISNSSVILNNQIWVCGGGCDWIGYDLKSVEMYDPLTNEWKCMKEMNECRRDAAAAVVNGKIFSSGGAGTNSVECYDSSSDVWTFVCNMPQSIQGHGAIEINGHFIVIGGCSGSPPHLKYLKNVWALDTKNKHAVWVEKPSIPILSQFFSIAKLHDKIFICGVGGTGDNVEIFDGEAWRNGPKMPTYKHMAAAAVIPVKFARCLN